MTISLYSWPVAALVVGVVTIALSRLMRVGIRPKDFPPGKEATTTLGEVGPAECLTSIRIGPPTLPIIGNLHQMTARPYQFFDKLAKECKLSTAAQLDFLRIDSAFIRTHCLAETRNSDHGDLEF